jgi:hypothetical protein
MKTEAIYAYCGKGGMPYDVRRLFGTNGSCGPLPVTSVARADWNSSNARLALERLGIRTASRAGGGLELIARPATEFSKEGPYRGYFNLQSVATRRIYEAGDDYVVEDSIAAANPWEMQESYHTHMADTMFTQIISVVKHAGSLENVLYTLDRDRQGISARYAR